MSESVRLFAYKAGMKLVSASADIDLQALKTSINLLAKLNITQTADSIDINATTKLSLSGGGSNITLTAGQILQQTSGNWIVHAANYDMEGPSTVPVNVHGFPEVSLALYNEKFRLLDTKRQPMTQMPYTVTNAADDGHEAMTWQQTGGTPRVSTKAAETLKFSLLWQEMEPAPMEPKHGEDES